MRIRPLGLIGPWLIGLLTLSPWLSLHPTLDTGETLGAFGAAVVINEIAWGGTAGSAQDEWIELFNTSGITVTLDGWRLRAVDGSPDLALAGAVGPYSAFLIERTDDNTVSDIPADLIRPFGTGLSNDGESLQLFDAEGRIVDTANADGGPWPNDGDGASPAYRSMERRTPWSPDVDENWLSNDGTITIGVDCYGNPINGTPRSDNASYIPILERYPDVVIAKWGSTVASPGDELTYTLQIRNLGGVTATRTVVTDTLPAALTVVGEGGTPFQSAVENVVQRIAFSDSAAPIVWVLGDLPPFSARRIDLVLRLRDDAPLGDEVVNLATVATSATEAITVNNTTSWTTVVTESLPGGQPAILISSVLYDGYQYLDEDEAVELVNVGAATAELEGWELCKAVTDGIACWPLPTMTIPAGARVWIARNAVAFEKSFGYSPHYQATGWPRLTNTGDEVVLRSGPSAYVDTLVYGDGSVSVPGWTGTAVRPYYNYLMDEAG